MVKEKISVPVDLQEREYTLDWLTALSPILLIVIAAMVGVIVYGIYSNPELVRDPHDSNSGHCFCCRLCCVQASG